MILFEIAKSLLGKSSKVSGTKSWLGTSIISLIFMIIMNVVGEYKKEKEIETEVANRLELVLQEMDLQSTKEELLMLQKDITIQAEIDNETRVVEESRNVVKTEALDAVKNEMRNDPNEAVDNNTYDGILDGMFDIYTEATKNYNHSEDGD